MPARTHDPIKAKQKRQKRIAIGGAALLLILVAVEGPSMFKRVHHKSTTPQWLVDARQGVTTPTPATPAAPVAPAPAAPGVAAAPVPVAGGGASGSTVLISDQAPTAGLGRLPSFGTFSSKDPFAAQVSIAPGSPTPPDAVDGYGIPKNGKASTGSGSASVPSTQVPAGGSSSAPGLTSAVISVNGVLASVTVGQDFPTPSSTIPNPLFHLVSLTAQTAKISIVGGSYATGAPTVTLVVGKPLTLENTADGTRYTLRLYKQGTKVPSSGETSSSTTSTSGTNQQPQAPPGPVVTTPLIPTTSLTP